jgi:hypothetical protein
MTAATEGPLGRGVRISSLALIALLLGILIAHQDQILKLNLFEKKTTADTTSGPDAAPAVFEETSASSVVVEKKCSAVDATTGICMDNDIATVGSRAEQDGVEKEVDEYTHKFNFECTDKHKDCARWANAGDCTGEPSGYVSLYCPKSCHKCDELAAKSDLNPNYLCKDDHYQCAEWAGETHTFTYYLKFL